MLELAHQLANTLEIDPLLNRFLDQLLKLYPNADRLMVFFFEGDQPVIRVARDHRASAGQEGLFSHSVLRQVREKGAAVLAGDAVAADPNTSLHALGVRSLLCAPLRTPGSPVMGAVQLDRFKAGSPFTHDDLHLLTAVTLQISLIIEKARMHQSIIQQQRIARELMLAREIQLAYLPTEYPVLSGDARLDMFAELHPANEISGDFYDFFLLDDTHVAMVVADVCGKGMPAALFMSMVRALLRQIATQEREPCEILRKMNQALARDNPKLMFVTMVLAVFHPLSGRATIARAGHPAPLLRRADGTVAEIAAPTGCLIGIMDPCPAFKPVQLDLQPGETVIFYTDGVTEAAGQHDDSLFGTGRLFGCLEKSPPDGHLRDWSATVRDDVRTFCGVSGPQDDITLLMFRRSA